MGLLCFGFVACVSPSILRCLAAFLCQSDVYLSAKQNLCLDLLNLPLIPRLLLFPHFFLVFGFLQGDQGVQYAKTKKMLDEKHTRFIFDIDELRAYDSNLAVEYVCYLSGMPEQLLTC
jgi:hypothetical protein